MREATVERKVCEWARLVGWLTYKWSSPNNRGVPDRIFIRAGRVVFVEFKRPGKTLRPLQEHVRDKLIAKGAEYHVVDSVEGGRRALT